MKTLLLPDALIAAGVNVRVMDGWQNAHSGGSYKWRESPTDPAGAMWHHTATSGYTPNRDKANGYAGLSVDGSQRLVQSGDGVPVYTVANAHPAPISSGYGVRAVLDDHVKHDVPFTGKQTRSDDSPQWAGNTHYWNTEVILDGIGGEMAQPVWDMLVTVGQVLNDVMGWTSARHIGHGMHTRRKPDLYDGRFTDMAATIAQLRIDIDNNEEETVVTHFKIGEEYELYEEVTWLLYQLGGGVVDVNQPSSQVGPVLGKVNVRLVTESDFDMIETVLHMDATETERLFDGGLYRFGKEIAKLRKLTYS